MHQAAGAKPQYRPRPSVVGGLIARMRHWFAASGSAASAGAAMAASHRATAIPGLASIADAPVRRVAQATRLMGASLAVGQAKFPHAPTVVQLPLNGRRLLVQLAQELYTRFASTTAQGDDPLLLTLATGSQQRLWIDSTAHVDVRDDQLPYRVVLGDVLTTRIILETSDFAEVTNFVCQYLLLTRGEASFAGGAA